MTRSRLYGVVDAGSVAAVAFIVACVTHEVPGHAAVCLAMGGQITLLNSSLFHGLGGGPWTDAAGPAANLVVGAILGVVLSRRQSGPLRVQRFLVLAMGFNLLWGAGSFIKSAATSTDDLAFAVRGWGGSMNGLARGVMGAVGLLLYVMALRAMGRRAPAGTRFVTSYLAAGVVSCLAVLFFAGPTMPALREAAAESLGATVGLLLIARRRRQDHSFDLPAQRQLASQRWLLASALVTLVFFLTLGHGLVRVSSL